MTRTFALALFGFSAVYAQTISSSCQSALTGIAGNADASACLAPGALIPLFIGSQNASSVISTIDGWVTNMCSSAPCSNTTLAAVVTNVTNACSTDLSNLGLTVSSSAQSTVISDVQQFYPTVRNVLCLKDGNTNCVTETLNNIENFIGSVSLSSIISMASGGSFNLPTNVTCTNCVKAAFSTINQDQPGLIPSDVNSTLSQECGSSFTDGSTPSGISEAASNTGKNNNAIAASDPTGVYLAAVLSALAVFMG